MKKILLASTALVGMAGAAAAEISLSGYAEIGIFGGDNVETQFHNDWQVNFNFSTETDNGLSIGGRVQIEETNSPASTNGGLRIDDEAFWVSGTFGKVTLGETDGAFDWALSEIYSGTALQDDHSTHVGAYWYTGMDGNYDNQIMRYEYSFGDFAVAISAEQDDDLRAISATNLANDGITADTILAVGGKWSGSMGGMDVGVGVGVQDNGTNTVVGLSASAAMSNGFSVSLGYADLDGTAFHSSSANGFSSTVDSWAGIGVAYTQGPLTVAANYGTFDTVTVNGAADTSGADGYGIVVNYDLGGGVVAMAGWGHSDNPTTAAVGSGSWNGNGEDTFSLGLGMSF
jgi:outer membrane protein OmpU